MIAPKYSSKVGTNKTFMNKETDDRALQHNVEPQRTRRDSLGSSSLSKSQIHNININPRANIRR